VACQPIILVGKWRPNNSFKREAASRLPLIQVLAPMRLFQVILLSFFLLMANSVWACVPVPPPEAKELLAGSAYIAEGIVVAESYPDYEAHLIAGGDPAKEPWPSTRMVRIVFTKSISGPLPPPTNIHAPCDWEFLSKVKGRVVVALYEDTFHFLLPYMEKELQALAPRHER
jgi:hypothetical protein